MEFMDTPYLFNKAVMPNGNGTDLKDFEMHFIKIMIIWKVIQITTVKVCR